MAPLRQQFARCGLRAAWSFAAMSLVACIAACGGGGSAGPSKAQSQVLSSLAVAITYHTMRVSEQRRVRLWKAGPVLRSDAGFQHRRGRAATVCGHWTYLGIGQRRPRDTEQ